MSALVLALALIMSEDLCGKIVGVPSIVVSSLLLCESTLTQHLAHLRYLAKCAQDVATNDSSENASTMPFRVTTPVLHLSLAEPHR